MGKNLRILFASITFSLFFGLLMFKVLIFFVPSTSGSWKKTLTGVELAEDINLLIPTFEKGYAGKNILKQEFPELIAGFQNILIQNPKGMDDYTLLSKFQNLLLQLPDGHLFASKDPGTCYVIDRRNQFTATSIKASSDYTFESINLNQKNVLKLRLPTFFIEDQSVVDNLINELSAKMRTADALIIDLRGNMGGYQPIPLRIGATIWGEPYREEQRIQFYPNPVEMSYLIRNKVSYSLLLNFFKSEDLQPEFQRQMASIYGTNPISPQEEDFSAAATEDWNTFLNDEPHLEDKGFPRPIYILVDNNCASACEVMLEALEKHPNKKVVGRQTRGAVQFGGVGKLTLPNSKISFSIPVSHVKYFDNRNIERVGYAPDILVKDGEDSLDVVIAFIK